MQAPTGYRFELEEACGHLQKDCSWVLVHVASGDRGRARARPEPRRRRTRRRQRAVRAGPRRQVPSEAWETVRTQEALLTPVGRASGKNLADGGDAKTTRSGGELDCPAGSTRRCGKMVNCSTKGGRCVDRNSKGRCLRRMYHRTCQRRCTCRVN